MCSLISAVWFRLFVGFTDYVFLRRALTWAIVGAQSFGSTYAADNWPSHRGPNQNYSVNSATEYPIQWSVAEDQNIYWRKVLPETGHSGIAVWKDRLFLTCFKQLTTADNRQGKNSRLETWASETRGYCLSAESGSILWSCELPGKRPNQVNGVFSDSTSPTPVTDGKHVWFVNAGGFMACYTIDGDLVWEREFDVRTKHSAKQFQPFLHGGKLYYAMLREKDDPKRRQQIAVDWDKNRKDGWPWMFVRSFDALTGERAGELPAGISCHSKGALVTTGRGLMLLHGRGGSHRPPEEPYGLGLTVLGETNELLWSQTKLNLEGTHFIDDAHAYCFQKSSLTVLNLSNGEVAKQIRVPQKATVTLFDESLGRYLQPTKIATNTWKRLLTHHASVGVGKYQFFMAGTPGILGRIDIEVGTVSFLQVPIQVRLVDHQKQLSWKKFLADDGTGSGFKVLGDARRLGNGFGHVTAATPVVVNNRVYFSTMLGTVYVVDAKAEAFDEKALLAVNDFGTPSKTWTLSSISVAGGRLYQRTSRELICVGDVSGKSNNRQAK